MIPSELALIRPPVTECLRPATLSIMPPLGVAYVAGALRAIGCRVHIIDAIGEAPRQLTRYIKGFLVGLRMDEIVARIPAQCSAVGISCTFTHDWPLVTELIRRIKEERPDRLVILGGEHVTALPDFCLMTSKADFLVMGEGEHTVQELWQHLRDGLDPYALNGIAYRRHSEIFVNPRRPREEKVDTLPRPSWEGFRLDVYHQMGYVCGVRTGALSVPIMATRGCPYQCSYCASPNMWTTMWKARTPSDVVDEMVDLNRRYGVTDFPLQDLTAIVRKDWIVTFCKELIRRELKFTWQFPSGTRCEAVDAEVADLLKRSGVMNLCYAPETGSERTRKLIKKQLRDENLQRSVEAARAAGLGITSFIVLGFPHETRADLWETVKFMRRLATWGVRDMSSGYYMALPGTELFHKLVRLGKIHFGRSYFRHILQGLEAFPTLSFNDRLSRTELFFWKVATFATFYGQRTWIAIRHFGRTSRPLRVLDEPSKMFTALRNLARNVGFFLAAQTEPRWIPKKAEAALFASWDMIFHKLHRQEMARLGEMPHDEDRPTNISGYVKKRHTLGFNLADAV